MVFVVASEVNINPTQILLHFFVLLHFICFYFKIESCLVALAGHELPV